MTLFHELRKHKFLFDELVKRDFVRKYKRTVLGMGWSICAPMLNLLVLWIVFGYLLKVNIPHFVIFLFSGQLVYSYFSEASSMGMMALLNNAPIFTKVNVPKYLFLLSQNVSSLINFGLTLFLYLVFILLDGLPITWKFICLLYPIACLLMFNVGIGLVLSALLVFFRDMQYLWGIASQIIMWGSAIFYSVDSFGPTVQKVFMLNPVFVFIEYFRNIVIQGNVPGIEIHLLLLLYSTTALAFGAWVYKRYNTEFLYYV